MVNRSRIKKDFSKVEKSLSSNQRFCEKQKYVKEQLLKNYDDKDGNNYTDRELLKRLPYLENGLGLYQAFYISVIIGAVFFVLSLFLPNIMQISSDLERKVAIHQYLLGSNEFYSKGYEQGTIHIKEGRIDDNGFITYSVDFDELDEQQEASYFDGYNYAINNGYGYSAFKFITLKTVSVYLVLTIGIYNYLKSQQNNFNKYQTNDFEIHLIKKRLGLIKNETKHYTVKLKNQGKKVRASVDEVEFIEEP